MRAVGPLGVRARVALGIVVGGVAAWVVLSGHAVQAILPSAILIAVVVAIVVSERNLLVSHWWYVPIVGLAVTGVVILALTGNRAIQIVGLIVVEIGVAGGVILFMTQASYNPYVEVTKPAAPFDETGDDVG